MGIIDAGRLLLESPLDDIRERFRMVIASGRDLPAAPTAQLLSVTGDSNSRKYVVTHDAEQFVTDLTNHGATVLQVLPLTLREVFLELVRREESCTRGNSGATAALAR